MQQQIAIGPGVGRRRDGDTPIFMRNYGVHVKTIATLGGGSLTVIVAGQDRGIHALQAGIGPVDHRAARHAEGHRRPTLHGMRYIMDDPRKAADVFVQAVPARKGQEDMIAGVLKAYVDHAYSGQAVTGETDPKRLEGLQRFYLSQHLVRNEVPVDELYTNEFIPPEE
jgi:hypothetical protein